MLNFLCVGRVVIGEILIECFIFLIWRWKVKCTNYTFHLQFHAYILIKLKNKSYLCD